jgi:glycosyltransferase involved in cell wall biosynthesis
METATVSVVLPTYDRAWCLARSIESVLRQTHEELELIVVDDGSTDGTERVVAGFTDPRLRYVRLARNGGAGAARNAGVVHARGRLLAFQDSDDEWLPAKLQRHLRAFETCAPDVAAVYSDMQRILRDGTTRHHRSPTLVPGVLVDPVTGFYQACKLGIQSAVIRRECFEAVGGFDESLPALEDMELFLRLSKRYRLYHLREPLVRYHETDGLSKNMAAKLIARRRLLDVYGSELLLDDPSFVAREAESLREAERRLTRGRERSHVPQQAGD